MSSMNIDKPLDDMVKANRGANKKRGGHKRGGRGGAAKAGAIGRQQAPVATSAAAVSANNRGRAPVVFPGRGAGTNTGSKIVVSNLPLDVTEAQVKELFATTIGPLRKIALSYKQNGQSSGICHIEFQRAEDASRSYSQYNQRLIDGKRPLKVEVIVDPAQQVPIVPVVAAAKPATRGAPAGAAAGSSRGRGRGRGGRRGGRNGPPREKKTAEDLDAEMEDYSKQSSTDAAPAA